MRSYWRMVSSVQIPAPQPLPIQRRAIKQFFSASAAGASERFEQRCSCYLNTGDRPNLETERRFSDLAAISRYSPGTSDYSPPDSFSQPDNGQSFRILVGSGRTFCVPVDKC